MTSNPGINPNIINSEQSQSMAASSAMITTGLEKELKTNKTNIVINDPKINLKQLEENIKKLSHSSSIEQIRKKEEKKKREEQREKQKRQQPKIFYSATRPAEPFEWNEKKSKSGNFIVDLFLNLQQRVLQKVFNLVLRHELNESIKIANELKIDIKDWNLEKFMVNSKGEMLLPSGISEKEIKYLLLREELKILEIGELLEDNWIHSQIIRLRKQYVVSTLYAMGAENEEVAQILTSAKQIAWLKLITQLKSTHLKRVFCGSKKDFDYFTKVISCYTQKIRKIDIAIPEEGVKWIKSRLEKLAFETAHFKLELLQSMQKLNHNNEREENIKWLKHTVGQLQHS